ncbi:MAG TPA: Ig-like domain-containing protein [Gemmatirosa sp.]
MLQLRSVPALRRALAVAAVLTTAGACGGSDSGTGVKSAVTTVAVTVPAQITVASNAGALGLQVVATYDRSSGPAATLGTQTVTVAGGGSQNIAFKLDLATCLNDASRAGGSSATTCSVHLQLTLTAGGTAVDAQTVGPYPLTGGATLTVSPALNFVQVASVQVVPTTGTAGAAGARTTVGTALPLTARVLDAGGNQLAGRTVVWSSSDATVATVDPATGIVTPVKVGTATISAAVAGQTGTLAVTVYTANTVAITGVSGATGTGSITSNPAGLACRIVGGAPSGTSCTSRPFPSDSAVTLTAAPDAGNTFGGWGGDCSSAGTALTCTVTPAAASTVTVKFLSAHDRASTLSLTLSDPNGTGGGSAALSGAGVDTTTCTLTAGQSTTTCSRLVDYGATPTVNVTRANTSQSFSFTASPTNSSCTGASCSIPSMTAAQTVTVTFVPAVAVSLTTAASDTGGRGGGYVASSPAGAGGVISCHRIARLTLGQTCATQYPVGTQVTLTATADALSTFVGWSGTGVSCASSGATCVFTVGANGAAPVATFAASPTANGLTIAPTGAGLGSLTITTVVTSAACDRTQVNRADGGTCIAPWNPIYVPSTGIVITATPASGSRFSGWLGCPPGRASGNTCTVSRYGVSAVAAQFDP